MPHLQPSQYRTSQYRTCQSYLQHPFRHTKIPSITMCFTMRILYACASNPTLAEKGCKSYNTRKELLQDSQTDAKHPPPVLAYCPEGRKRVDAGAPDCEPSESFKAGDEIVCPLKCPTCWDAFLDRLNFSTEEADAMRSKVADTHKNMDVMDVDVEVCWVTIGMEVVADSCKADKDSFEAEWDGVVLKVADAIRENDYNLAAARMKELPQRRLAYDGYEARRMKVLEEC